MNPVPWKLETPLATDIILGWGIRRSGASQNPQLKPGEGRAASQTAGDKNKENTSKLG
jgi:hypothetical protein